MHLQDTRKEQETALRIYSHLKRYALALPSAPIGRVRQGLTVPPHSTLKDHCVQHLPDGSVTVESILIQAAAHSEDPGTKVLLVSWTYQVRVVGITVYPPNRVSHFLVFCAAWSGVTCALYFPAG